MSQYQTFELWNLSGVRRAVGGESERLNADDPSGERQAEILPAQDICRSRHKGNPQSVAAHNAIMERLTVQQERVFRCILDGGERGRTNEDICGVLGLTPNQVSPRLTELHVAGRITKVGTRLTRSKCPAGVWKAI